MCYSQSSQSLVSRRLSASHQSATSQSRHYILTFATFYMLMKFIIKLKDIITSFTSKNRDARNKSLKKKEIHFLILESLDFRVLLIMIFIIEILDIWVDIILIVIKVFWVLIIVRFVIVIISINVFVLISSFVIIIDSLKLLIIIVLLITIELSSWLRLIVEVIEKSKWRFDLKIWHVWLWWIFLKTSLIF